MELLTTNAIAQMLGVSRKCIYRWVQLRKIPFIKLEKHLRFQPELVIQHFQEKTDWAAPACFQSDILIQNIQGRKGHGSLKSEGEAAGSYSLKG